MMWGYRYFSESEFNRPEEMHHELLARLDLARGMAQVPFEITSDYRAPTGDPDEKPSAHHIGKAVDIACTDSRARDRILKGARYAKFRRIGIYDKHIHLDVATEADGFDQDVTWWGESK